MHMCELELGGQGSETDDSDGPLVKLDGVQAFLQLLRAQRESPARVHLEKSEGP